MIKKKRGVFTFMLCLMMVLGSTIVTQAYTREFSFTIVTSSGGGYAATKDDNEQLAYVTPTSYTGNSSSWIAVWSERWSSPSNKSTSWTFTRSNYTTRKTMPYINYAYAGDYYYLAYQASGSGSGVMQGRWTP